MNNALRGVRKERLCLYFIYARKDGEVIYFIISAALDDMSRGFEYDEIQWRSVYEKAVSIVFKNEGSTVYAVDVDPFSLQTINAADNS